MPRSEPGSEDTRTIGAWHGVRIEAAPRDAVTVDAALAIAGMFTREVAGDGPRGGLLHLDQTLGGALSGFRSDGIFRASLGEMLTLSAPAPPIRAKRVLIVGLGDPAEWSLDRLRIAVTGAARQALRLEAASAAFAPSLLDSGIDPEATRGAPEALLTGLIDALPPERTNATLRRWVFCTGTARLEATAREFRSALSRFGPA